jgi:hypothetical protein
MRVVVQRIEVDLGHRTAPLAELGRSRGTPLGRPGGQYDAESAAPRVVAGDGHGDVGGTAEQQQGLRDTHRVDHADSVT